ncbi:MAG: hypothetical protein IH845_01570 [Nanoarchaeota archaeon]|nr:hypothetical protein [Nanoarchaeota archaeon]
MFIKSCDVSLIKNSRKEKTIQVVLNTYEGKFVCSAPSGKSKGKSEVLSYHVKGIGHSLKMLKVFCAKLKHKNFLIKKLSDIKKLTEVMHRFEAHHGKFGGNVFYVMEGVFLKAAAADKKLELWEFINDSVNNGHKPKMPTAVGNLFGGGLHSNTLPGKRPDFQEFLLIPNEKTFSRGVTVNYRAYEYARWLLKTLRRNDEGALATSKTNEESLEVMVKLSKKFKIRIGLDIAASSFYENGYYKYKNKDLIRDKTDQVDYIERLILKFGIFYVEDPMQEEDFSGFKQIMNTVKDYKKKSLIVGDDLTTTNIRLVRRAVASDSMNAMVIKPNQIGSILEVAEVVRYCKRHKIIMIFSHRSGETMDDILGDYVVGFGGHFIKTGIYGRERLIKLKRVMDIERSLR